jgi:hypothetical protein
MSNPKNDKSKIIKKMTDLCYIIDSVFLPVDYEKISPNNLSEFRNVTNKFSKVMHNTISQLQSEFSEDIIKVDGTPEQNLRNPELVKAIEEQVYNLGKKISELLNEINEMKAAPINKPNDEIR